MMYWYGHGMGGWGFALMTVSQILFWALIIAGIVALVRYVGRRSQHTGSFGASRQTPEQLLAERFARGEISEEEYQRGLDLLRRHHSTPGS
ncbi:SHOCT domain-containing protein [Amycolatopsis pigmentata]|uniref:SHOCT domain-containing protein n=1 Tax=Amycolatopsis pigmentata TaxID=450801 RepID=A0ABW5G276_9PSEU